MMNTAGIKTEEEINYQINFILEFNVMQVHLKNEYEINGKHQSLYSIH
jgi:hypothetical protein